MTDFAQEPLWEEEAAEPLVVKAPQVPAPDPVAAAGNAAMAQAMPSQEPETPPPDMRKADAAPALPAIAERDASITQKPLPKAAKLEVEAPRNPAAEAPKPKAEPAEWEPALATVLRALGRPNLGEALQSLLEHAAQIPEGRIAPAAGALVSAFLALPAEARKPARDALVTQLKRRPDLAFCRLVLTRLGGPAVAPPPSPPAPASP